MVEDGSLWQDGSRKQAPFAVISQRVSDLLLSFPSAALGGLLWQTLVRKYEERHAARLDPTALGHQSVLDMINALLRDVLRLVDASDVNNPTIAAQDSVVMVPCPGALGSWPSLYQALCNAVLSHGIPEKTPEPDLVTSAAEAKVEPESQQNSGEPMRGLLLSQLKPLLQVHWHAGFDESSLGYLSDDGNFVRLRKLKHLVQAVLRWRELRVTWLAETNSPASIVDEVLVPTFELVQSKKHSDLVLRCMRNGAVVNPVPGSAAAHTEPGARPVVESRSLRKSLTSSMRSVDLPSTTHEIPPVPSISSYYSTAVEQRNDGCVVPMSPAMPTSELEKEVALLRVENAELRNKHELLKQHVELCSTPAKAPQQLDDPYEPPPEVRPLVSTGSPVWAQPSPPSPRAVSASAMSAEQFSTDLQMGEENAVQDEDDSRTQAEQNEMFASMESQSMTTVDGAPRRWAKQIPKGIVQQARARFE